LNQKPLENHLVHRVLIGTNNLQRLPALIVTALLILDALIAALFWADQGAALIMGATVLIGGLINWFILWMLPRRGKSFGVEKASTLALGAVIGLIAAMLGLLNLDAILAVILIGLICIAVFYATWIEPFRLGVSHETLQQAGWQTPIKVLHITDIHIERITDRERKLNHLVKLLKPDLIVFTGDFVNLSYTHDERAKQDIREILSEWRAPLGIYCVPGTPIVEPLNVVKSFVDGLENLKLLLNEWHTVETPGGKLHILGVITTHILSTDRAAFHEAMKAAPPDGMRLLLAHSADIAPEAADAGIDWMLCGHTHGGQLRLPVIGAFMSASHLGLRFVMGRYSVGRMTLYVSRGVGMEGLGAPRARFLCPPEVILWKVS